jgi:hypothetical protein
VPLPSPNLDDRTFDELVAGAVARIKAAGAAWKEPAPGDPGMVLIDAFAYVTEQLLFRLNRIPEKAYVEFLNLIGATLYPPSAANVTLTFTTQQPASAKIVIPRGTRVSAARLAGGTAEIVFATVDDATIVQGNTSVDVVAIAAERVENELIGTGTGAGGQSCFVARPPIVGPSNSSFDPTVAVEMGDGSSISRSDALVVDGVAYEIWHEVDSFADADPQAPAYVCDRASGKISFAPALRESDGDALAESPVFVARVPASGKKIVASYATGGGSAGNVVAGTLTTLKDQVTGASLAVMNHAAASGGRSGETLENALVRGPREFHSLQRAVTARDFELIACRNANVARARAYPKHELWNYAEPGTVAVLLVPEYLEPEQRATGAVTAAALQLLQTAETLERIRATVDERRPLGIVCEVDWVRYKTVKVKAGVVVARGENAAAVQVRIVEKLHSLINPLPTPGSQGWRFGRPLHVSDVTSLILAERGVVYYHDVELIVDDVPSADVTAISSDPTASGRWYATAGANLYRTLDDAQTWEKVAAFSGERVVKVALSEDAPGTIAVVSQTGEDGTPIASIVRVSSNAGESWGAPSRLEGLKVADVAWIQRSGGPVLQLATDKGLYEVGLREGSAPVQVPVFDGDSQFGFFSITATVVNGRPVVVVAAQARKGIYISNQGGLGRTFEQWYDPPVPDVSVVRIQRSGARAFLWAGYSAVGTDVGNGASRIEISGAPKNASATTWDSFDNWSGQGVRELAFSSTTVFAASYSRGVVRLNPNTDKPAWLPTALGHGLPERQKITEGFELIATVAATSAGAVLAGGAKGVFKSDDGGDTYAPASATSFRDVVALPPMWLFCSAPHEVDVTEDKRS